MSNTRITNDTVPDVELFPQRYNCRLYWCWVRSFSQDWKVYPQRRSAEPSLMQGVRAWSWDIAVDPGYGNTNTRKGMLICTEHDSIFQDMWTADTAAAVAEDAATYAWTVLNGGRI